MFATSAAAYICTRIFAPVVEGLDMLEWPAAFSGIIFGLFSIPAILNVLPNATYLLLDRSGLTMRTCFVTKNFKWSDIHAFHVIHVGHSTWRVGIAYKHPVAEPARIRNLKESVKCDGLVPSNFGMAPEELASLLNEHRDRFLNGTEREGQSGVQ